MKNNGRVFLRRLCICFILAVFLASLYPGFDVAYADLTCTHCNGRGEVSCSNCGGSSRTCYSCHGSGYVTCGYCRGSGRLGADLSGYPESSDGSTTSTHTSQKPKISKPFLSTCILYLVVGHNEQLTLDGAKATVSWKSSNPKIATVSSKGKVTGKSAGEATITAKSDGKSYKCEVHVTPQVLAKKITLKEKTKTIPNHTYTRLKYTLTPDSSTITEPYTLEWTSSNTEVATVAKDGRIDAKKAGSTKITVSLKGGDKVVSKATCTLKVKSVYAKEIALNAEETEVLNGHSQSIGYTISPDEETITEPYTLKWVSSNTKVATVDQSGKVTGKKAGSTKITVSLKVGNKVVSKATSTIKIKSIWAKKISFSQKTETLRIGKTLTLKGKISPAEYTLTEPFSLQWTSSAPSIASVSDNGTVTGKKAGTAKITVSLIVKDKVVSKATCTVKVQSAQTQFLEGFKQIASEQDGKLVYNSGMLTVIYDNSTNLFSFIKDEGYTSVKLTMPKGFQGRARLDYQYTSRFGGSTRIEATAKSALGSLTRNTNFDWTFTAGDNKTMADTSTYVLLNLMNDFVSNQMKWSMKEMGITNY